MIREKMTGTKLKTGEKLMDYKDTKIWKKFIEKCKNEKEK